LNLSQAVTFCLPHNTDYVTAVSILSFFWSDSRVTRAALPFNTTLLQVLNIDPDVSFLYFSAGGTLFKYTGRFSSRRAAISLPEWAGNNLNAKANILVFFDVIVFSKEVAAGAVLCVVMPVERISREIEQKQNAANLFKSVEETLAQMYLPLSAATWGHI
jgi:hypothetical protein